MALLRLFGRNIKSKFNENSNLKGCRSGKILKIRGIWWENGKDGLKNLEQLNVVRLPEKIACKWRRAEKPIVWTQCSEPQTDIDCELAQLMPIELQVVTEAEAVREWNELVDRHHYLGYRCPFGPYLRYFIVDCQGRRLGCLMFTYATLSLPCRDQWMGWQDKKHKKHLDLVVKNNRFLILPWVRVKNLASKALSTACRQLADDWQQQYGYQPVLIETFVDPQRFDGSCYTHQSRMQPVLEKPITI